MLSLTVSDVTVLKQRERSFRLLFDNNPMPMWVFDADTMDFLSVNDAAVQHYGYAREKFLGMKLHEIWPQDEWAPHSQSLRELGDVYHSTRDWRHIKADGSEIHVLTFGRRVVQRRAAGRRDRGALGRVSRAGVESGVRHAAARARTASRYPTEAAAVGLRSAWSACRCG